MKMASKDSASDFDMPLRRITPETTSSEAVGATGAAVGGALLQATNNNGTPTPQKSQHAQLGRQPTARGSVAPTLRAPGMRAARRNARACAA